MSITEIPKRHSKLPCPLAIKALRGGATSIQRLVERELDRRFGDFVCVLITVGWRGERLNFLSFSILAVGRWFPSPPHFHKTPAAVWEYTGIAVVVGEASPGGGAASKSKLARRAPRKHAARNGVQGERSLGTLGGNHACRRAPPPSRRQLTARRPPRRRHRF